jgi:UTP pyrophosphatase
LSAALKYLAGYPEEIIGQVEGLIAQERLGEWLLEKYPAAHGIRTDRALYEYVIELKNAFLRSSAPLSKIVYDNKLHVVQHALGTHTTVFRVQGSKLKAKREIRLAAQLRECPLEFLRMLAVHELAHLRERDHDKAFYQLCTRMEPRYHQFEFHLRLYLTHLDAGGKPAWR